MPVVGRCLPVLRSLAWVLVEGPGTRMKMLLIAVARPIAPARRNDLFQNIPKLIKPFRESIVTMRPDLQVLRSGNKIYCAAVEYIDVDVFSRPLICLNSFQTRNQFVPFSIFRCEADSLRAKPWVLFLSDFDFVFQSLSPSL